MNIKRIALQNTKPSDKSVLWLKPEGDKLAVAVFDGKWRYLDVKDTDAKVAQIEESLNSLIGVNDITTVIDTFNEVKNLLTGIDNNTNLLQVLEDNEKVTAQALNDLNDRINACASAIEAIQNS